MFRISLLSAAVRVVRVVLVALAALVAEARPCFAQEGQGVTPAPVTPAPVTPVPVTPAPVVEDSTAACVGAYESAQLARRAQRWLDARRDLRICGGEACPAVVQRDCVDWLAQAEAAIPTIILEAKTDAGAVFDVAASLDGRPLTLMLDGRPIEIDPGLHRVVFAHAGRPSIEQRIIVREGEKNRLVLADWSTPARAPTASEILSDRVERPVPASVYVSAGIAFLGFVDFAIAAAFGDSLKNQLADSGCAPFCARVETDALRTRYLVADIGLGVGIADVVTGALLFVTRPEKRIITRAAAGSGPPSPGFQLETQSSRAVVTYRVAF